MSGSQLGPMTLGLVAILCAPALLWATTLLERLMAEPSATARRLRASQIDVRINRKAR